MLLNTFLTLVILALVIAILEVGEKLLIPFVLALFFWFLIDALGAAFGRWSIRGRHLPRRWARTAAFGAIFFASMGGMEIVSGNVREIITLAPAYQANLDDLLVRVSRRLGNEEPPDIAQLFSQLDIRMLLTRFARFITSVVKSSLLIAIYLIFIFIEQSRFDRKLAASVENPDKRTQILSVVGKIEKKVRLYLGIKTATSLTTALLSYLVMVAVGLDFASFWAFLIFILNFIPVIGSIVATIFPAVLALIQFNTIVPFLVVAGGVQAVQTFIGQVVEPKLLGDTLNLSPLAIILSLAIWGRIWGITGMLLCVPITVIAMIILSQFSNTRPAAVWLSAKGSLNPNI